jgi:hypothetical protein
MSERMDAMRSRMKQIRETDDPHERATLMQEQMTAMQAQVEAMGTMMHNGGMPAGADGMGMTGDMAMHRPMMEKHMAMMRDMMQKCEPADKK